MRKLNLLLLSFCFTLCSLNLHSQWVSIPDNNFGTWLNSSYSACMQGNNTIGWQMDTTCSAVENATILYPQFANISDLTGIEYFDNLQQLGCNNNQLSSLPPLPATLTTLWCDNNQLTSLPALPPSLTVLNCATNQLTTLPALPASLTDLVCEENLIVALPVLPAGLVNLYCRANALSALPTLPATLTYLSCGDNLLDVLPALPGSLTTLECDNNHLIALPALPNGLNWLSCSLNQLTALPLLPNSITNLQVQNNLQLTSIPPLPDSLNVFYMGGNTALTCLPQLKIVRELDFLNTGITCLPNYPADNWSSTPALNTVPLCNLFNANGCAAYWNINGTVYHDADNNCANGTNEPELNNINVSLYSNGALEQEMLTRYNGSYTFVAGNGSYTYSIDTVSLPFTVTCPDSGYYISVISATDTMHTGMDFGLRCKAGFDLEARGMTTPTAFRPANNTLVNIAAGDAAKFYGVTCAAGTGGSVTLTYSGPVQFVSAANGALTPTLSGNTLTWSVADFGNVNFFTAFNIIMHTDTNAQIGGEVCFTLTVNPIAGDNNPGNNVLNFCFPIVNSYDPNDKTAYPSGNIDTAQKELTYTIRFQNTGNAEAIHIYITDTLDSDVDASTFQLLAYSHQPMVQLKENAVRFNFPNINLPDSNTNEPASHGYVQYKVKLKPNLPIGTVINNTAYIYFDFNAPVITNTTTNTISLNTGIAGIGHPSPDIRLFPNPTNGSVTISIPESLIGSTATVSDVMGRVVFKSEIANSKSEINLAGVGSGIYFITLGNGTQKLIITK